MKYCEDCGLALEEGATVCPECGCVVDMPENAIKETKAKKEVKIEKSEASQLTVEIKKGGFRPSVVGMILGIVGILLVFASPLFAFVTSIAALIFSIAGMSKKRRSKLSVAALILSIAAVVVALVAILLDILTVMFFTVLMFVVNLLPVFFNIAAF